MKKILITFLIFLINISLFNMGIAHDDSQGFFSDVHCGQSNKAENNIKCLKKCIHDLNQINISQNNFKTNQINKKFDKKPDFIDSIDTFQNNHNNQLIFNYRKFLFYNDFQFKIKDKSYISLIGIILNLN